MFLLTSELSIIADSNPSNGALIPSGSTDGSTFSMLLAESLNIPKTAKNLTVEVQTAEIYWTVPNVITNVNDQFRVISDGSGSNPATIATYTVTNPQGLFSRPGINSSILELLVNAGAESDIITIGESASTNKVLISTPYTGISIEFRDVQLPRNMRVLLGYNDQLLGPSTTSPTSWLADNIAQFNTVNSFLINSDIVETGIPLNSKQQKIIANIPIDVLPGYQIIFNPYRPAKIPANNLKGSRRKRIKFWLTDDQGRLVNTGGEYWRLRLVIRYNP